MTINQNFFWWSLFILGFNASLREWVGSWMSSAEIVILNDSSRKDMSVIVIYSQDDVENLQSCENK